MGTEEEMSTHESGWGGENGTRVVFKKDVNFIYTILLLYVKNNTNMIKCPHLSILGARSKNVCYLFLLYFSVLK